MMITDKLYSYGDRHVTFDQDRRYCDPVSNFHELDDVEQHLTRHGFKWAVFKVEYANSSRVLKKNYGFVLVLDETTPMEEEYGR
jgi:hypothetical protein